MQSVERLGYGLDGPGFESRREKKIITCIGRKFNRYSSTMIYFTVLL